MKVYLDNNATTAVDRRVFNAMKPYFCSTYGNPNSLHSYGTAANKAVREALGTLYRLLRADESDTVLVTSGSTESNNTVIRGVYERTVRPRSVNSPKVRPLFVTSAIEHPSVTEAFARIASDGRADVAVVQPRRDGTISAEDVARALDPRRTALVSVMWANNETGAVNPVAAIARAAHRAGGLFHTDATQAIGKVPLSGPPLGADFMSISAHKFHGPKGVGALYIRRGRPVHTMEPLLRGGEQMAGLRAGTINVPGVVGMARAAEIVMSKEGLLALRRVRWLRDRLEDGILRGVPNAVVVSPDRDKRVPNTLLVAFPGVEGEALIYDLNELGIAASTGSACASENLQPSVVLNAIGGSSNRGSELSHTGVRFSLSRFTTKKEIDYTVDAVVKSVKRLYSFSAASNKEKKEKKECCIRK